MKRISGLRLIGLFLIVFGVIYLDTKDMGLSPNLKAYTAMLLGLIIVVVSFVIDIKKRKNNTEL